MRKNIATNTLEAFSLSRECLTFLFFVFVFSISTGVFFETLMSNEIKADMQAYLQGLILSPTAGGTGTGAIASSALANISMIIIIVFSGYTRFSYPVSFILLFFKGLSLGYCCALILETMAAKGVFVILFSLVPQNALLIPALFAASNMAAAKAGMMKHKKNKGMAGTVILSDPPYLYAAGLLCAIAVISCILQSLFLPVAARVI